MRKNGMNERIVETLAVLLLSSQLAGVAVAAASDTRLQYSPSSPGAPFSQAVRVDDVLYLSGQIGFDSQNRLPAGMEAQARQVMENIAAVLRDNGASMRDVFKCAVMLSDMTQWAAFNKVYVSYFESGRLPARSAFGTNGLVGGALVELECWALLPRRQ